jgi:hypothetical protein
MNFLNGPDGPEQREADRLERAQDDAEQDYFDSLDADDWKLDPDNFT